MGTQLGRLVRVGVRPADLTGALADPERAALPGVTTRGAQVLLPLTDRLIVLHPVAAPAADLAWQIRDDPSGAVLAEVQVTATATSGGSRVELAATPAGDHPGSDAATVAALDLLVQAALNLEAVLTAAPSSSAAADPAAASPEPSSPEPSSAGITADTTRPTRRRLAVVAVAAAIAAAILAALVHHRTRPPLDRDHRDAV